MLETVSPFVIDASPVGVNTDTVESLSSYIQRLSTINCLSVRSMLQTLAEATHLPITRRLNSRLLRTIDVQPAFVPAQLLVSGTRWETLRLMSFIRLYETFYGSMGPGHACVQVFFMAPYGKRSIETNRRWCSLCLRMAPAYRLMWQLSDVRVCLTHGCLLSYRCTACKNSVPVLHMSSLFDHCNVCYAPLSRQPIISAPDQLLERQTTIQGDYGWLFNGNLGFSTWAQDASWKRRLIYLREVHKLSREELGKSLGVSPSTIILLESEATIVSFQVILHAARYLAGSLRALAQVSPPSGWLPTPVYKPPLFRRPNTIRANPRRLKLLKQVTAGIKQLKTQGANLTIARLSGATHIPKRTLEQTLATTPFLRHRYWVTKTQIDRVLIIKRVRQGILKIIRGHRNASHRHTIQLVCRAAGTTDDRLAQMDKNLYSSIKAQVLEARVQAQHRRDEELRQRLVATMRKRAAQGLSCSRRAISQELGVEFKNYPDIYAIWRRLRGLHAN